MSQTEVPVPIMQCIRCEGTIWRQGDWFQCPDCGCRSTSFGGYFPSISPDGKPQGAPADFIEAVNAVKSISSKEKHE